MRLVNYSVQITVRPVHRLVPFLEGGGAPLITAEEN
jgi:hypothetical protein